MRHWLLSGPVGPMSVAGPLQFAIGSRLPSWGQGIFEMATYTREGQIWDRQTLEEGPKPTQYKC